MNIIAIIPARMGSSRFPGKPMAQIHGMPMIGHVCLRTALSNLLSNTYVATCDQVIYDYVRSIGGKPLMTSEKHERASDRTAEAMIKIEELTGKKVDIVVMVQGDEPMVTPHMIDKSVQPLIDDPNINVVNLMAEIKDVEDFEDANEVKVVVDLFDNAIYFSREPIPSRRKGSNSVPMLKQVCVIPFRRDYLLKFNSMNQTPLEMIESVDMMRIIENGEKVRMVMTLETTSSVDTHDDLIWAGQLMKDDPLMISYSKR